MKTDFFNDQLEDNDLIIKPNEGERYEIGENSFTFKITSEISNNQLGVYEIVYSTLLKIL